MNKTNKQTIIIIQDRHGILGTKERNKQRSHKSKNGK